MPDSTVQSSTTQPWFTYILECTDGSLYTGVAIDVAARYKQHVNGKGARYTRSHPPKQLLLAMEFPDRSAALQAEITIKKLSKTAKHLFIELCKVTSVKIPT